MSHSVIEPYEFKTLFSLLFTYRYSRRCYSVVLFEQFGHPRGENFVLVLAGLSLQRGII